jgi:hypothetical protein
MGMVALSPPSVDGERSLGPTTATPFLKAWLASVNQRGWKTTSSLASTTRGALVALTPALIFSG